MYRFEGHQLIRFGIVIALAGLAFVIWAAASGTGWLYGGGAGVAVVGAVQMLIGWDHLRHEAGAEAADARPSAAGAADAESKEG
jgi:hypothetical protein